MRWSRDPSRRRRRRRARRGLRGPPRPCTAEPCPARPPPPGRGREAVRPDAVHDPSRCPSTAARRGRPGRRRGRATSGLARRRRRSGARRTSAIATNWLRGPPPRRIHHPPDEIVSDAPSHPRETSVSSGGRHAKSRDGIGRHVLVEDRARSALPSPDARSQMEECAATSTALEIRGPPPARWTPCPRPGAAWLDDHLAAALPPGQPSARVQIRADHLVAAAGDGLPPHPTGPCRATCGRATKEPRPRQPHVAGRPTRCAPRYRRTIASIPICTSSPAGSTTRRRRRGPTAPSGPVGRPAGLPARPDAGTTTDRDTSDSCSASPRRGPAALLCDAAGGHPAGSIRVRRRRVSSTSAPAAPLERRTTSAFAADGTLYFSTPAPTLDVPKRRMIQSPAAATASTRPGHAPLHERDVRHRRRCSSLPRTLTPRLLDDRRRPPEIMASCRNDARRARRCADGPG